MATATQTTRLDHVVVAVRDLEQASAAFAAAGFVVEYGGRHEGWGTHNSLVPLPSGQFLELIAAFDPDEVARSGENGLLLLDAVERAPASLLGFCVTCADADKAVKQLRRLGVESSGAMTIRRESAVWRLIFINGLAWRRPWPMVIEHPAGQTRSGHPRLAGSHPNGAQRLTALAVAADDVDAAARLTEHGLGALPLSANVFALGGSILSLHATNGRGQGPFSLRMTALRPDGITGLLGLPIEARTPADDDIEAGTLESVS